MAKTKKVSQSRPARWERACSAASEALSDARSAIDNGEQAVTDAINEHDGDPEHAEVVKVISDIEGEIGAAISAIEDAFGELVDLKGEYEEWRDNLPESLQSSAVAEKLSAVCDLDVEPSFLEITIKVNVDKPSDPGDGEFDIEVEFENVGELDDIEGAINDAEGADLPLGFGKD